MDLIKAPRGELLKLVYELIDENQALKAQIAELREQLGNRKPDSKTLPDFVKPNIKKKPPKPRKNRTQHFARKLDVPTDHVFHAYETCPNCQGPLGKPTVVYKRQVIDLPVTEVKVTEHVICKRWCIKCQQRVTPKVDLSSQVVGQHRVGVNLMSQIATLRENLRLPIRVIQVYLQTFYKLKLSAGEIIEVLGKVSQLGEKARQEILTQLKESPAIYGDETGWREDGRNGYLWNFSNEKLQYLLYRRSRGSQVVAEILGEDGSEYEGVLVTDFYNAYNEHAGFHQRCWVHLLRDIHELEEANLDNKEVKRWVKLVKGVYLQAKEYTGPDSRLQLGLQARERLKKEAELKEELQRICEGVLGRDSPVAGIASRIYKYLPELFTFVRLPGVLADNNLAERALRHSVVQRKIFGGTRSGKGSQIKSVLGSLFGTWRLQGLNPVEQCRLLLTNSVCQ